MQVHKEGDLGGLVVFYDCFAVVAHDTECSHAIHVPQCVQSKSRVRYFPQCSQKLCIPVVVHFPFLMVPA